MRRVIQRFPRRVGTRRKSPPRMPRGFAICLSVAIASLGIGCEGLINGTKRRDASENRGAGSASATSDANDGDMRAQNPELHDIALDYFPETETQNAPKRVFRLTRTQLDISAKTLLQAHYDASAVATLPRDALQTNYEYSENLSFNAANFTPYTNWVTQMALRVKAAPETIIDCATSNNSPECLATEAKKFVSKAFRGVTTDAMLARYADFFNASVAQVGLADATADLVDVTLTSPNFVFREEVQTDGSNVLMPAQFLQSITYTLADAPPETVGLSSETPTEHVQTADAVKKTIDAVLATPEARAKLIRFFVAWLEVKEPDEFTIASNVFPEFTPEVAVAVVEETQRFLDHQLAAAAPKLKDITESTQSFVTETLAAIYDVENPSATELVDLDPAKRLGVFTQPAVLASHSGPTTTRLVKRGVFFTRKIMCLPLGSPPPELDTTIPTTAGATERERVASVTQAAKCAGCHAYINPFGFMLENYDAIGRFRTKDEGLPIDASITVDFLDEGTLTANSPVESLKGFTRSLLFQQCFARQLFRFYSGRDETAGDDPVLRQMFFDFANNDEQDIIGMLRILAGSSVLSQRSEAP